MQVNNYTRDIKCFENSVSKMLLTLPSLKVEWRMISGLVLKWCCQTNSNQSQHAAKCRNLCQTELAPLCESGTVELEIVSAVERALLVEMVADGGMNGDEFLQTSHATEPLHGAFSSSKRQVRILRPIVQPVARFLLVGIADILHCGAVGSKFVGYQYMRVAMALH